MGVFNSKDASLLVGAPSIGHIAGELDRAGVVWLDDVVSGEWVAAAGADVRKRLVATGPGQHFVDRPGDEHGTPAHMFSTDPKVLALLRGLAHARCPHGTTVDDTMFTALNILWGAPHEDSAPWFHYDASTITMVVPLLMVPGPRSESSGELVVFANQRPFRRFTAVNIVEKAITQNRIYRQRAVRRYRRDPEAHIVDMKLGSVYLFWGYRTFHGTLGCAADAIRATLLLHYGSPHGSSRVLAAAKSVGRALPVMT